MRTYELTVIFKPNLEAKELDKHLAAVAALVTKAGAKVKSKVDPIKKPLAYEIKKVAEGYYAFFTLEMEPAMVAPIDTSLKLEDQIIRYLLVNSD